MASWKEGVGKESKAKDFGEALLICGQPVYANIGGLVLKRNLINLTATLLSLTFQESGVPILPGPSLISLGAILSCSEGAIWPRQFSNLVD